jgi:hypothetical protein
MSPRITGLVEETSIPDSCLREVCMKLDPDTTICEDFIKWDFYANETIDTSSGFGDTVCYQFLELEGRDYRVIAHATDRVPPPENSRWTDSVDCAYEIGYVGEVGYQVDKYFCCCDSGQIAPPNYLACVFVPFNVTALCDGWVNFWHFENTSCDSGSVHNEIEDIIPAFMKGCIDEAYDKAFVNRNVMFPMNYPGSSYPEVHWINSYSQFGVLTNDYTQTVDIHLYYDYQSDLVVAPDILKMFYLDEETCRWRLIKESYPDLENKYVNSPEQGVLGKYYTIMGFIPPPKVLDNVGNYPNPFRPGQGDWPEGATRITYTLTEPCDVTIKIFSQPGGLIREFYFDYEDPAGGTGDETSIWHEVEWDGKNGEGRLVANGSYVVHIEAASHVDGDVHTAIHLVATSR